MENDKENAVIGGKEKPCRRPTSIKSMSGEYALLSGYLGKISAGVNQSATVMNTFKTVMQQSGETVKNRRRNSKGSRSNEHSVNRFC